MEYIVSTDKMSRRFGSKYVVKDVSMHIKQGEIYGLIGRNGAGKTTIMKMLGGLIAPTKGSVELMDVPINEALEKGVLAKVGTLIESPGLQNGMTGRENIELKCICAGLKYDDAYIRGLLQTVGLADAENKKAGNYSLGMKQRLGIALALVGEPEMLILDEPINGLDPQGIVEVREILLKLHRERNMTIIISSHILEELSKLVMTCGIIDNGVLLREFSREQMEYECRNRVLILTDRPDDAAKVLNENGFTKTVVTDAKTLEVFDRPDDTPDMLFALCGAGIPVREVTRGGQTLEEFFFGIVGGGKNA